MGLLSWRKYWSCATSTHPSSFTVWGWGDALSRARGKRQALQLEAFLSLTNVHRGHCHCPSSIGTRRLLLFAGTVAEALAAAPADPGVLRVLTGECTSCSTRSSTACSLGLPSCREAGAEVCDDNSASELSGRGGTLPATAGSVGAHSELPRTNSSGVGCPPALNAATGLACGGVSSSRRRAGWSARRPSRSSARRVAPRQRISCRAKLDAGRSLWHSGHVTRPGSVAVGVALAVACCPTF